MANTADISLIWAERVQIDISSPNTVSVPMETIANNLIHLFRKHPLSTESASLAYGTSGYRCNASLLRGVATRIGAYAAMLSSLRRGLAVGVMITASHNPPDDNGIKLVDSDGGMLSPELDESIVEFVRMSGSPPSEKTVKWTLESMVKFAYDFSVVPVVYIGSDTRATCGELAEEVEQGVSCMGGVSTNFGLVTTPQLHYLVQIQGTIGPPDPIRDYVDTFAARFARAFSTLRCEKRGPVVDNIHLNVDCAHGVGALAINALAARLQTEFSDSNYPRDRPTFSIQAFNTLTCHKDLLNKNCGADYVKLYSKVPQLIPDTVAESFAINSRWASIDGDADRLVYFFKPSVTSATSVCLIDGDRIAGLMAQFIAQQLAKLEVSNDCLTLGIVQTAYSNAASTRYFEETLGVRVRCALTGVKYLHKAAKEFDFGVYFEANGHGTVLLSEKAIAFVKVLPQCHPLRIFVSLVNTAVGDAISGMLVVEYILAAGGLRSLAEWYASTYTDLASLQIKVCIADKAAIETTDMDRVAVKPEGLQRSIDELVGQVDTATLTPRTSRAFVRPSGTENIVRVYAESSTQPLASWLAKSVALLVYDLANGVGCKPEAPGVLTI